VIRPGFSTGPVENVYGFLDTPGQVLEWRPPVGLDFRPPPSKLSGKRGFWTFDRRENIKYLFFLFPFISLRSLVFYLYVYLLIQLLLFFLRCVFSVLFFVFFPSVFLSYLFVLLELLLLIDYPSFLSLPLL
jgi:hypothetical protein